VTTHSKAKAKEGILWFAGCEDKNLEAGQDRIELCCIDFRSCLAAVLCKNMAMDTESNRFCISKPTAIPELVCSVLKKLQLEVVVPVPI